MEFNKGEWSEAYASIKLIGEGKVYASDENLNMNPDRLYPILKLFKDEIEKYYETNGEDGIVNIIDYQGNIITSVPSSEFTKIAAESLKVIKESEGSSFEVHILENFLKSIGMEKFKSSSNKKEDIKMEIFDKILDKPETLTFSLKSELGNKATILNASGLTNFLFKIEGISDSEIEELNTINKEVSKKWLKIKFGKIFESYKKGDYKITFVDDENSTFFQNMRLIDSRLPEILSYILLYYFSHEKIVDIKTLTEKLIEENPLKLNDSEKELFYKKKIYDFIEAATFGMMPKVKWDGNYSVTGGLLTVKKDGEVLCHHIFYDSDSLKKYLYKNSKLETPSSSRHGYGQLFKDNGEVFFKLNLQVRFK